MKTLLTYLLDHVVVHHNGTDYKLPHSAGSIKIPPAQIEKLPEAVVLILVLLAGARKFYVPKETYFCLRERIWTCLDRNHGGLNAVGLGIFSGDPAVLEAANQHKAAVQEKGKAKK